MPIMIFLFQGDWSVTASGADVGYICLVMIVDGYLAGSPHSVAIGLADPQARDSEAVV
jgi:hypothetical protein